MTTTITIREPQYGVAVEEKVTVITVTNATVVVPPVDTSIFVLKSQIGAALGVASLDETQKIPLEQIPASILGAANYQGIWNADTNLNPTILSGVGQKGQYWVVAVPGSTDIDSVTDWKLGDWVIFNGTAWEKVDNTDAVNSVNGKIGAVVVDKNDVGLGNVDNTSDANKPLSTAQQTALNAKANLASPTFTGTPASTTPGSTDNTTRIATTAFVVSATCRRANNLSDVASRQLSRMNINQGETALTYAASIVTNTTLGNIFTVTLTGNAVLANPTGMVAGATYMWKITQDATGSRLLSYGSNFKWPGGVVGIVSTAPNAIDVISAYYDGTNLYAVIQKGFA